jgi:conjugal transfer pilus assembly protein TraU
MRSTKIHKNIMLAILPFLAAGLLRPTSALADTTCPSAFSKVFTKSINTLHNVFPIKLGGVTIVNLKDLEDFDDSGASILCVCKAPPPIFMRVGIPLHMWEPANVIETVQHPWCSPTAGMNLNLGINKRNIGGETELGVLSSRSASAQVHLIKYPVFFLLGLFVDFVCLTQSGFDFLYVTELDPLWQNDTWASILSPEGQLFANMALQAVCPVDAIAATAGFPINYLFWCAGAWGQIYPFSKNMKSPDYVQTNAGIAAKFIAKMHREFILWQTTGKQMLRGWCTHFPNPIWKKTQYGLIMIYPQSISKRQPIGRSILLWTPGLKMRPFDRANFVFFMYRARDCCAF